MRSGFSLVELLIALVILQVGVLATASLAVSAQEAMREAERSERIDWTVRTLADSFSVLREVSPGEVEVAGRRLRWQTNGTGVLLEVVGTAGRIEDHFRLSTAASGTL